MSDLLTVNIVTFRSAVMLFSILHSFFFFDFSLQDHIFQQISSQISLLNDNSFQSISGLTLTTYFLTLSAHLSLLLPSGRFPFGVFSNTILIKTLYLSRKCSAHLSLQYCIIVLIKCLF